MFPDEDPGEALRLVNEALDAGRTVMVGHLFMDTPAGATTMTCATCGAIYTCGPGGGISMNAKMIRGPYWCGTKIDPNTGVNIKTYRARGAQRLGWVAQRGIVWVTTFENCTVEPTAEEKGK